jgi:hypothetical protein
MDLVEVAMDRDAIYAKLGVPPEEPESGLDRWARMKAEREEPPPRERKLDIVPPTLAEVDQRIGERIAAEHKFMIDILGELLAHLQNDAEMRGPPGPSGPRGEQGPPGKLPLLKLWEPDVVHYQGDVVTHDGGTWQATRDTGKAPGTKDWVALAAPVATGGRRGCAGPIARTRPTRLSTSSCASRHRSSRCVTTPDRVRAMAGRSPPAAASAALPARRESAVLPARGVIQD